MQQPTSRPLAPERTSLPGTPCTLSSTLPRCHQSRAAPCRSRSGSGGGGGSNSDSGSRLPPQLPPGISDLGFSAMRAPKLVLSQDDRRRLDERPDREFYSAPRLGEHADAQALEWLSGLYKEVLTSSGVRRVLDLCSSYTSHLPPGLTLDEVVGIGMNPQELKRNVSLTRWVVQDLNEQPLLQQLASRSFDAVLCCSGLAYLTQIEVVVSELARVLVPGGLLVASWGPDCYQDKATVAWLQRDMAGRGQLLTSVLAANGFGAATQQLRWQPTDGPGPSTTGASMAREACSPAAAAPPPQQQQEHPQQQQQGAQGCHQFCVLLARTAAPRAARLEPSQVANWLVAPALPSVGSPWSDSQLGPGAAPGPDVLLQWRRAYDALAAEARQLGIPDSAIPRLPPPGEALTAQQLQEAQQHLQGMVASFLSSGL